MRDMPQVRRQYFGRRSLLLWSSISSACVLYTYAFLIGHEGTYLNVEWLKCCRILGRRFG